MITRRSLWKRALTKVALSLTKRRVARTMCSRRFRFGSNLVNYSQLTPLCSIYFVLALPICNARSLLSCLAPGCWGVRDISRCRLSKTGRFRRLASKIFQFFISMKIIEYWYGDYYWVFIFILIDSFKFDKNWYEYFLFFFWFSFILNKLFKHNYTEKRVYSLKII